MKCKARSDEFLDITFSKGNKSHLRRRENLTWTQISDFFGKNLTTFGTFGSKSQIQCRYYQNLTQIFQNLTDYLPNFT